MPSLLKKNLPPEFPTLEVGINKRFFSNEVVGVALAGGPSML